MDSKQNVLGVTICAVINDILAWILTNGKRQINLKRAFENKDLMNVFVIVDEFEDLREVEDVTNHFQISAIGNPQRYPIDVIELIYRRPSSVSRGGIYLKFLGGEIPVVLYPNTLVMDDKAINAVVTAIIKSNKDLLDLLEFKSGGNRAAKRIGK